MCKSEMKKEFPEIRTSRLCLRRFQEDDLENVFRGLSNEEVVKYYGVNYSSLDSTREQMQWFADLEESGTGIWWAISSEDKISFFGAVGFNNLSREHRKAELGFWLLPDFWGKGFIQEVVPKVLRYAFENLNLHRIEAYVESENVASAKALQKLQFECEGRMKDCEVKNGKFISVDIFALLNKNYSTT